MSLCKDCKYFIKNQGGFIDKNYGKCNCKKFVYDGFSNDPDYNITDQLIYGDYESYNAFFEVGDDFGCIHFKKRRNNK